MKDAKKLQSAGVAHKAPEWVALLYNDPLRSPTFLKKLGGGLAGACSRRISIHKRLVYQVFAEQKIVRALRMWTLYE